MEKTPVRILRRMGYKADNQGIIDRFINVYGAWEEHLRLTRSFILKAVTGKKIENLAVYGSGWLLDLPLDELSKLAGHVWLYDLIHPAQVMHRLRNYSNVTAVTADITGGIVVNAYNAVRDYKKKRNKIMPEQLCSSAFNSRVEHDYCISLNVLSQLGAMISDYLKRNIPYSQQETDRINMLLQMAHLQLLLPRRSCLITDINESCYDGTNQLVESTGTVMCKLPSGGRSENWEWQFDPEGGYKAGNKTVLHVVAIEL